MTDYSDMSDEDLVKEIRAPRTDHAPAADRLCPVAGRLQTCQERLPEVVKVPVRVTVPATAKLTDPCLVQRAESRALRGVVAA